MAAKTLFEVAVVGDVAATLREPPSTLIVDVTDRDVDVNGGAEERPDVSRDVPAVCARINGVPRTYR
jgi:hypothetical protein